MQNGVSAQTTFDIRFSLSDIDCNTNTVCYDVQLRSSTGDNYGLAGQNYRFYYDNSLADYISGSKVLDSNYGPFTLVQDLGPVDATSSSTNLGFESTLGFVNYAIDLFNTNTGGAFIDGDWLTTSNVCFSVQQSVIDNPSQCLDIIWARDGLTNSLATAFVEVAEWQSTNMTGPVIAGNHIDLNMTSGNDACLSSLCTASTTASVGAISFSESIGTAQVQVCLDEVQDTDAMMMVSTVDGTATGGQDFISIEDEMLMIPAGDLCTMIDITVFDDAVVEGNELFMIELIAQSPGLLIDDSAMVEIIDNDIACEADAPTVGPK